MGLPAPHHRYSYEDYLTIEEDSSLKHEYWNGEIYAMAGGTPLHAALAAAVTVRLAAVLAGRPCRVYSSDLRIRSIETGLATYPDVTVICGPIELDPLSATTAINPTLVVEVSSKATEEYDRTEKLEHYEQIKSLRGCLLVSHREPRIELFERSSDDGWRKLEARAGQSVTIEALGCRLSVDEVYGDLLETA